MRKLKDQVLALNAKGLTVSEIAERIGARPEYVRATRSRAGLALSWPEHRKAQIVSRLSALKVEERSLRNELSELRGAGA